MIEVRRTVCLRVESPEHICAAKLYKALDAITVGEIIDVEVWGRAAEITVHCYDDEYSGRNPAEEYERELIKEFEEVGYKVVR